MSARSMIVSVLVNLVDRMTGPLRRLQAGLNGLADAGRRIGAIGVVAAGISFAAPIQQAAAFDAILRDIAITAGKTGAQVEKLIGSAGEKYQKLALQVGQRSADLATAAQTLVSAGMDEGLIQRLMPTIGKVATAANAQLNDTAKTAFALSDALKIPANQMELAMAKLVTAGKLGRFEFKSMASEFPELTAQVAKLGVTGMEAVDFLGAALQTAMKGTNNPATAANNLKNFLSKIASPETRKNFEKELGVDIVGVMTNATARGMNPIEAVMEKLMAKLAVPKKEVDDILRKAKATGMSDKDAADALRGRLQQLLQGSKLGNIFGDMQVQDFLIPFMLNRAGFKLDKAQIQGATTQVVDDDFASRMRGLEKDLLRFQEIGTQVMRRVGMAFATNLAPASAALDGLLGYIRQVDERFPGLVDKTLSWAGALLVLGAGLAILAPVFGALGAALGLIVSPLGLIAAGLTALIATIYSFRQEIFAALVAMAQWAARLPALAMEGLSAFGTALMTFGTRAMALFDAALRAGAEIALAGLVGLFGLRLQTLSFIGQTLAEIGRAGMMAFDTALRAGVELALQVFVAMPQRLIGTLAGLATALTDAGSRAMQGLWDGMKAKFEELIGWVAAIPGRIVAAIGNIDLSNVVRWPSLPSWLGGGGPGQGRSGTTGGTGQGGGGAVPPAPGQGGFSPSPGQQGNLGGSNGFAQRERVGAAETRVGGRIVVQAAPGTTVKEAQSDTPGLALVPDRGLMVGRA